MPGMPVEAALAVFLVACGAAFFTGAALAFRGRTGKLLADLASAIGRKAERLRKEGCPAPVSERIERLPDEVRRILARRGLAASPAPRTLR